MTSPCTSSDYPTVPPPPSKSVKAPSEAPSKVKSENPPASVAGSKKNTPPPPPSVAPSSKSKAPGSKPSTQLTYRPAYVEVDHYAESAAGNANDDDDVKSQATHKTGGSQRSRSRSHASGAPASEYSIHEREREFRRYSRPNEWETFRYVEAPAAPLFPSRSRSRSVNTKPPMIMDSRASLDGYGPKVNEQIVINDNGRRIGVNWTR